MNSLLFLCLAAPLAGAVSVAALGRHKEALVSRLTVLFTTLYSGAALSLIGLWLFRGANSHEWNAGLLYQSPAYRFPLVFYLDGNGAAFLGVTAFIFSIITRYCRYYMHREEDYARFFSTIFCFVFGMTFILLAGTVDLLFAGWEIVGISSYLLIAFYRRRDNPVRNALMTYSVYRVCDVGVLLGAWLTHLIWHQSQHFSTLGLAITPQTLESHGGELLVLSLLIFLAAAGKSAQFPFCFWLPRAMEGPTPSSAIFYGAISVHAGVFLLLRTYPLWHAIPMAPWILGAIGITSALIGTLSGRVQSNIKGQIAYASLAQVGLMLVELAAGLPRLALIHFIGNAGLRCYQLLVSPSVVAYVLRLQATPGSRKRVSDWSLERLLPSRVRSTAYAFAFNEGYLLTLVRKLVLQPLLGLGSFLHRLDGKGGRAVGAGVAFGLILASRLAGTIPDLWLAIPTAALMAAASMSALSETQKALRAWNAVGFSCFFAGVAIYLASGPLDKDMLTYFMGVVPPWMLGVAFVRYLTRTLGPEDQLARFQGKVHGHPAASFGLFLCFLAMAGFPIGPAFVGEDALLHYVVKGDLWLAVAFIFGFVINGISMARLFSRLCLGSPEFPSGGKASYGEPVNRQNA